MAEAHGIPQIIHGKIVVLAKELGNDARALGWDEEIPSSGVLDSAGIMELVLWLETEFGIEIDQASLTLENFGTVNAITSYLAKTNAI